MVNITAADRVIALFIAAAATGVYLCSLFYCVRWLVYTDEGWKIRKRIDWTMLSGTLAIFCLSSIHTSLAVSTTFDLVRDLETHTVSKSTKLPWTSVVMCTVTNIAVLIADGYLIFRCWLVFSKSLKRIAFPSIFWVGGVACTVLQVYWQVVQSAEIPAVWTPVNMTIGPGTILTPFWGSTIVVNIYSTISIVYCIWRNARLQKDISSPTRDLRFIMRVVIESGAFYLLVTIPHFIVWWTTSSLAILILGWTNLPVVGSAFNLILIRISKHRAHKLKQDSSSMTTSTIHFSLPTTAVYFDSTCDAVVTHDRELSVSTTESAYS